MNATSIINSPIQSQTQPFDTEATRIIRINGASAPNFHKSVDVLFKLTAVAGASQTVSVGLVEQRLDPATGASIWVPIASNITIQAGSTITALPNGQTPVTVPAGRIVQNVDVAILRVVGDMVFITPSSYTTGVVALRVVGSVTTGGALATYVGSSRVGQIGLA
jgi:hypothetical protein